MEREFVSTSDIGTNHHPFLSTLIWLVGHDINMAIDRLYDINMAEMT